MPSPPTIFSQLNSSLHPEEFSRCVELFPPQRPPRGLTEYDQFLAFCFGQLTYRESLRDIVSCLQAKKPLLYHLGFRGNISRTNLAYANGHRDWRLFQAIAEILMRQAARLYQAAPCDPDVPKVAFALDSLDHFSELESVPLGLLRTFQASDAQVAFDAGFTG